MRDYLGEINEISERIGAVKERKHEMCEEINRIRNEIRRIESEISDLRDKRADLKETYRTAHTCDFYRPMDDYDIQDFVSRNGFINGKGYKFLGVLVRNN